MFTNYCTIGEVAARLGVRFPAARIFRFARNPFVPLSHQGDTWPEFCLSIEIACGMSFAKQVLFRQVQNMEMRCLRIGIVPKHVLLGNRNEVLGK